MTGICGDDCAYCPRYIYTKNGRIEELGKVKELWVRLGLRDISFPVQEMACDGCKPENKCAYPELRACANKRAVDNCGLCQEYPCEMVNAAFEKSEKLYFNTIRVCTPDEVKMLNRAFFSKRQKLDRIHRKVTE